MYHGPIDQVLDFFATMSLCLPERKGIADFLQEVVSKNDQQVRDLVALTGLPGVSADTHSQHAFSPGPLCQQQHAAACSRTLSCPCCQCLHEVCLGVPEVKVLSCTAQCTALCTAAACWHAGGHLSCCWCMQQYHSKESGAPWQYISCQEMSDNFKRFHVGKAMHAQLAAPMTPDLQQQNVRQTQHVAVLIWIASSAKAVSQLLPALCSLKLGQESGPQLLKHAAGSRTVR